MEEGQTFRRNELILTFGIWRFEDISHEEITKAFEVQPTRVCIAGEKKNEKVSSLWHYNGWLYEPHSDKHDIYSNEPVVSMTKFLNGLSEEAKIICKNHKCEVSCAVFVYSNNGESTPWVHLDKEYSKVANELGVAFDLDLYVL